MKRITKGTEAPPAKRSKRATVYTRVPLSLKTRTTGSVTYIASRTQHTQALDFFPFGTGTNDRERNTVQFQGVTIDLAFRNLDINQRVFRWAIVQPKFPSLARSINFFKGYNGERGLDFSLVTRSGAQLANLPINRGAFTVLSQGKINVAGTTENSEVLPVMHYEHNYHTINKKIEFDSGAVSQPYIPTEFIFWWDSPLASIADPSNNNFSCKIYQIKYFRDVV